jgi:hypothetical protein
MNNCVASYARGAVRGSSLLFHAAKDGESVTIEVSPQGHVVQASGPNNRRNTAAKWAQRALGRWAKGFPKETGDRRREGSFRAGTVRRRPRDTVLGLMRGEEAVL